MKVIFKKPPALNHLYGTNKWGGKYLKKAGKEWKESALAQLLPLRKDNFAEKCAMIVNLYTCRHQDNDSILKVLQDTLQEAGVYVDDYWIFDMCVFKHRCSIKDERVEIEIVPFKDSFVRNYQSMNE